MQRFSPILLLLLLVLSASLAIAANEIEGYVVHGDAAKVEQLLAADPTQANAQLQNGRSPLFFASTAEVADLLLAKGANIEARDQYGFTPLIFAAGCGKDQIVATLLAHGANVEACDNNTMTALQNGAHYLAVVKLLVEKGAKVNAVNQYGGSAILFAVGGRGDPAIIDYLLAHGADLQAKNNAGATALHIAASGYMDSWGMVHHRDQPQPVAPAETPSMVAYLLAKKFDVQAKDNNGCTPLHYAVKATYGRLADIELLLAHGANPNALDTYRQTPLSVLFTRDLNNTDHEAVPQIAALLLAKGAKPDLDPNLMDAMAIATGNGNDMMRITAGLVAGKCGVTLRDRYRRRSPLHFAALGGNAEGVRALVEGKADVMARDSDGATPLHYAYTPEIYDYLLAHGADAKALTTNGYTILHQAVRLGNKPMVEYLLAQGFDINTRDNQGRTPLITAIPLIDHGVVDLLLEKGADINAKANDGTTPTAVAVKAHRTQLADMLKQRGGVE